MVSSPTLATMSFFAVRYTYIDDQDRIAAVRPDHREFLRSLVEAGSLRASGPFVDVSPPAALLIFAAASEAEVRDLLDSDPFGQQGIVASVEVTQWDPVIGAFADD